MRTVEVMVQPEINDVGLAIKKIVIEAKRVSADGFQAGEDLSAIAIASFQPLMDAISGMEKIGAEFKENRTAAIMGIVLPVVDAVNELV